MFKIAEAARSRFRPLALAGLEQAGSALDHYCVSEEWSANLAEGTLCLGEKSGMLHGIPGRFCGLSGLSRVYDPADRHHILGLFEQAAANPSTFCFSTTIHQTDGHRQPVFCMAESVAGPQHAPLSLAGMFVFPRFRVESSRLAALSSPIVHYA